MLALVRRSRELGFSLEQIRPLLTLWQDRQRASADVKALARRPSAGLEQKIAELTRLRGALADRVACCHGDARPDGPILDTLGG